MLEHHGLGQKGDKLLPHAHGARSGPTSAVGGAEGLVEVEVQHVEPHVSGTDLPQNGVGVGAVVVEQPSGIVHQGSHFGDLFFEESQGVGVGEHDARHPMVQEPPKGLKIDVAPVVGGDLYHIEPRHGGGGGIGAVGRIGHDHGAALTLSPAGSATCSAILRPAGVC